MAANKGLLWLRLGEQRPGVPRPGVQESESVGWGQRGFREARPGEERRLPPALPPVGLGAESSGDAETPGVDQGGGRNSGRGRNPTVAEYWGGWGQRAAPRALSEGVSAGTLSLCAQSEAAE